MSELLERLKDWAASDGSCHEADERGFCQACSTRMPCDWALALADITEAADEIERLRRDLRLLADRLLADEIDRGEGAEMMWEGPDR